MPANGIRNDEIVIPSKASPALTRARLENLDRMLVEEDARHRGTMKDLNDYRLVIQEQCPHEWESSPGGDKCSVCGKTL